MTERLYRVDLDYPLSTGTKTFSQFFVVRDPQTIKILLQIQDQGGAIWDSVAAYIIGKKNPQEISCLSQVENHYHDDLVNHHRSKEMTVAEFLAGA